MTLFVAVLFTIRFYLHRRKIEKSLYNSPSIVFLGAGEKAIQHVASEVKKHKDMHYAHHKKGILVAPKNHGDVGKMNAKKLVYIFDSAKPTKEQIKKYKDHKSSFGNKLYAAAFNAKRFAEAGKVHDLSTDEGTEKLKGLINEALNQ